ncbi:HAD-like protein [Dacryopinax primogenitus]|uniref:HAD-like protein n=1 Tax=Dacryopinax primogenitus (strain DJM 731) TaxID=1858805 RepID=M5FUB6_DACPD|nr:HAD-like protein [Dacryopinax primogenitus]EJT99798.1 HAD-like protein [Dacryopinax primogenitus]
MSTTKTSTPRLTSSSILSRLLNKFLFTSLLSSNAALESVPRTQVIQTGQEGKDIKRIRESQQQTITAVLSDKKSHEDTGAHISDVVLVVKGHMRNASTATDDTAVDTPPVTAPTPPPGYVQPYDTIIFDIGDVLFTWEPAPNRSIPGGTFKLILRSHAFYEYECGRLTEEEFYRSTADRLNVPYEDVQAAFHDARESLVPNPLMPPLIRQLKENHKILAGSNISKPDFDWLHARPGFDWDVFDRIHASYAIGARKPDHSFFRSIIDSEKLDPARVIFIDDKVENVLTAKSLGVAGFVFRDQESAVRTLWALCADPVERGWKWVEENKGRMHSFTGQGKDVEENFTQMLILELTGRADIVNYDKYDRLFHFYQGDKQPTIKEFPYDMDTTSIGLSICPHIKPEMRHDVMNEMLTCLNTDNIIQTYFDRKRPRIDPIVCCNILTLFYSNGRGDEPLLQQTKAWVIDTLKTRAYLGGTTYYHCAETYLFFFSRLLLHSPELCAQYLDLLLIRIRERVGIPSEACGLALRMLLCAQHDLDPGQDFKLLLLAQESDGGWPAGGFYRYPGNGVMIGHRGWVTCVALEAIKRGRERGWSADLKEIIC